MTTAKMTAYTLQELILALGDKDLAKIGHNTYARRVEDPKTDLGCIAVCYHETNIIRFNPMGTRVTVDCGGWHTATTAGRIHEFLQANGGASCGIKSGTIRVTDSAGISFPLTAPITIETDSGELFCESAETAPVVGSFSLSSGIALF